jgi:hypothetical protein
VNEQRSEVKDLGSVPDIYGFHTDLDPNQRVRIQIFTDKNLKPDTEP